MSTETLEYKLQSLGLGSSVKIPAESKQITDSLLCKAQAAVMLGQPISYNEFVAVPGIHAALLEYGTRKIPLNVAMDVVVLYVAEAIATKGQQYKDLLPGIIGVSRDVLDFYNRCR